MNKETESILRNIRDNTKWSNTSILEVLEADKRDKVALIYFKKNG